MEANNNPKPKRKLELKKEVITILQDEQMAKIFGGVTVTDSQLTDCTVTACKSDLKHCGETGANC